MPSVCAVYGCFNTKVKTAGTSIRDFGFPKNAHNRDVWVNLCRRADSINPKNAVICSVHFTRDDYIEDMKSRLLGIESPRNNMLADGSDQYFMTLVWRTCRASCLN